jgi:hypothetical protein
MNAALAAAPFGRRARIRKAFGSLVVRELCHRARYLDDPQRVLANRELTASPRATDLTDTKAPAPVAEEATGLLGTVDSS